MDTLLAERELPGYPGARAELHILNHVVTTLVRDTSGEVVLYNGHDRRRAKDCFFHPFVFGYQYNNYTGEEAWNT